MQILVFNYIGIPQPGKSSDVFATPNCKAGYYCLSSAIISDPSSVDPVSNRWGPCPSWSYCPEGSSNPIPCPHGKYNPNSLSQSLTDCIDCLAGYACTSSGMHTYLTTPCAAGFYCSTGSKTDKPFGKHCLAGYSCPSGSSSMLPCSSGTYQDQIGQSSCNLCPKGFYCPTQTSIIDSSIACPAGYFCPTGTKNMNDNPCPLGTYNPRLYATSSSDCLACPPGKYCDSPGRISPTGDCDAGYYCTLSSPTKTPINTPAVPVTYGDKCKAGYYCPLG